MNRNIFIAIMVILLVAIGIFWFMQSRLSTSNQLPPGTADETSSGATSGTVVNVVPPSLDATQKLAHDVRRIIDLGEIQNALEIYFVKNFRYPISIANWSYLKTLTGTTTMPVDVASGQSYGYAVNASGSSYVLATQLEDANNVALKNSFSGNKFASSTETFVLSNGLATCGVSGIYCVSIW